MEPMEPVEPFETQQMQFGAMSIWSLQQNSTQKGAKMEPIKRANGAINWLHLLAPWEGFWLHGAGPT